MLLLRCFLLDYNMIQWILQWPQLLNLWRLVYLL